MWVWGTVAGTDDFNAAFDRVASGWDISFDSRVKVWGGLDGRGVEECRRRPSCSRKEKNFLQKQRETKV